MLARDELIARLRALLDGEAALRWAYLFGSAARVGRRNDVDIAILPEDAFSLLDLAGLQGRLADALGERVDLVDLRMAALPVIGAVLAERVLLLDREPAERRDWEATTASRWLDFRPAWDESFAVRTEARRRRLAGSG